MKKNMIEAYYVENGKLKILMNQNTARDIKIAIEAFKAAMELTDFNQIDRIKLTGNYIADKFLQDEVLKILVTEDYAGCVPCSVKFLQTVENKVDELL